MTLDIRAGDLLTAGSIIVAAIAITRPLLHALRNQDDQKRKVNLMWSVFKQRFKLQENGEPRDDIFGEEG